jgi:hypothetical protein
MSTMFSGFEDTASDEERELNSSRYRCWSKRCATHFKMKVGESTFKLLASDFAVFIQEVWARCVTKVPVSNKISLFHGAHIGEEVGPD